MEPIKLLLLRGRGHHLLVVVVLLLVLRGHAGRRRPTGPRRGAARGHAGRGPAGGHTWPAVAAVPGTATPPPTAGDLAGPWAWSRSATELPGAWRRPVPPRRRRALRQRQPRRALLAHVRRPGPVALVGGSHVWGAGLLVLLRRTAVGGLRAHAWRTSPPRRLLLLRGRGPCAGGRPPSRARR